MSKPISHLLATFVIAALPQVGAHASTHVAPTSNENEAPLLLSTDPGAERFRPVGKLSASSQCTATLIAGAHLPADSASALVLTAGHCVGSFDTNKVLVNEAAPNNWTFTPAYFVDNGPQHRSFAVRRIAYATMKNVDLAVLELGATYADLAAVDVYPMHLYATQPEPTAGIQVAHVPIQDIPVYERFLRLSNCHADTRRTIFESLYPWLWSEAVPNLCQGIRGGSSGSPVVLQNQNEVVGVINTTVDPSRNGCGLNRPCELEGKAGLIREGVSYYIPIDVIAQALTADSKLDLSKLDPGDGATLTRKLHAYWATQRTVDDGDGTRVPAPWNLTIGEESQQVRYKTGLADRTSCAGIDGYGDTIDAAEQPLKNLAIPSAEGIYKICVIARQAGQDKWQEPAYASFMLHQIDNTPPVSTPRLRFDESDTFWIAYAEDDLYDVFTRTIKYGPLAETDCDDPEGFFTPSPIFPGVRLNKAEAPWRFCAKGFDIAGNVSPVVYQDFVN
ncbi:trypsin-like serine peptidase [Dyella mobilis]|uniref:Trypsin-like peptidase domain-containing protein n=1 Tax=Dyella mobilis TaxID=1849582 RepID=A0ABS2KL31_9GAMM|nr:trypsin-like peptidase domain-containing protein [Dyella mobilis]MBM7131851.1 hypothetical protein [Dyella mobilis]GLQ96169.1 trypsin [Dyella mobilis]